jgi:transcriptional regulator with XRE-family HTH domain
MTPVVGRASRHTEHAGNGLSPAEGLKDFVHGHGKREIDRISGNPSSRNPGNNPGNPGKRKPGRPRKPELEARRAGPLLDLAKRLEIIRAELDLTLTGMAAYIGVPMTRYQNWERALHWPDPEAMITLSKNTGISLDYIYRGEPGATKPERLQRLQMRERGADPDDPRIQGHGKGKGRRAKGET